MAGAAESRLLFRRFTTAQGAFVADILTFIATMTGHLAWPLSLMLLIVMFRRRIDPMLQRLAKFEAGTDGLSFEFHKKLQAVEQRVDHETTQKGILREGPAPAIAGPKTLGLPALLELADAHPTAAVSEAWRSVEGAILRAAPKAADAAARGETPPQAVRIAADAGVSRDVIDVLIDLRALRNKAAHAVLGAVTTDEAETYVRLAARTASEVITQMQD